MDLASLLLPVATLFLLLGIKRVQADERLLVYRFKRYFGVRGPGTVVLLVLVDKAVRLRLDERVPHWRSLSETELRQELDRIGQSLEREQSSPEEPPNNKIQPTSRS